MCGIVSVWLKNKLIDPEALAASVATLDHRGPDEKNIWISPEKNVGLGHARLSIVGIDNGSQPLVNAEHGIYAVVNGEFYDYKNIREHYQKNGYKFLTDTDSEIIIPLYLEYGAQIFDKLNGEFSFIIWDKRQQIIFAARDRFGIKPLFYSYEIGNFYAASEIKALLALGLKAEWNEHAINSVFKGVPSQSLTCFKNIKQVRPGHYLIVSRDNIKEEKYWDFEYKDGPSEVSDEEYISLFREKLLTAIKRRLVADVPVGFYLSGGIDSSAVLALSSQLSKNIHAFNISFHDSVHDENVFAKEMASYIGIELSSIKVSSQDLADNFSDVIFHREAPVFQTNGIAKYLLSKHVRNAGFKVVVTGEGADETLAGYPFFKEDMVNHLDLRQKQGSSFMLPGNYDTENMNKIVKRLRYLPSLWKISFHAGNAIQEIYSDYFKQVSATYNPMEEFINDSFPLDINDAHPVNKSLYIFSKTFFPENILCYLGDRVEMAHSIEGRLPFLDVDLVKFSNSLPIELKIKELKEKYILYEAVKDLVPKSIYLRDKHPITTPSAIDDKDPDKKSPLETLMYDVFHSKDFKEMHFFDQAKTIKLLGSLRGIEPSARRISEFALNFALSTYFLQKRLISL